MQKHRTALEEHVPGPRGKAEVGFSPEPGESQILEKQLGSRLDSRGDAAVILDHFLELGRVSTSARVDDTNVANDLIDIRLLKWCREGAGNGEEKGKDESQRTVHK